MARLSGVRPEEMSDRQREVAAIMVKGPRGHASGLMALWLYAPELAERMQSVGAYLRFEAKLPQRLREMTILMVARDWACLHEWHTHQSLAERSGLGRDVIEAIRLQLEPEFQDDDERAVYKYVQELLRRRRVSASSFSNIVERYGPEGVIELAGLIGHYVIGAATLNAVEYDLPSGVSAPFET
jgi:4-carboxymuconolactone decarboxylase